MPDVKEFRNIDKNSFGKLESHVPHEIAHQWFYAAIGNDSYKEPWLDEGFSEFCEDILFPHNVFCSFLLAQWNIRGFA